MANIIVSDSFFNLAPREPLIVTRGKVKYLSFQPVLDGEKRDSKKKQKSAMMDGAGSVMFSPYQMGQWDLHRAIVRDYRKVKAASDKEFQAWIVSLATCLGDLFESFPPDLLLRGLIGTPLTEWRNEIDALDLAIRQIDLGRAEELTEKRIETMATGHKREFPSTLSRKLKEFTFPELDYKQKRGAKDAALALGTTSLIGWLWLMVARETQNGVKYIECRGFNIPHKDPHSGLNVDGCGRWVPTLNPKNNPMTVCSKNCSARADRAAKKAAKTPKK